MNEEQRKVFYKLPIGQSPLAKLVPLTPRLNIWQRVNNWFWDLFDKDEEHNFDNDDDL